VLEALLRALHPIMPFITEEIWQRFAPLARQVGIATHSIDTVMLAPYPKASQFDRDAAAEREAQWLRDIILAVRQIRGEMDIAPSRRLRIVLQNASADDRNQVERHRVYLERLAGLETIEFLAAGATPPPAATGLIGDLVVLVPMAGLIDPAAELDRLGKRIARQETDLAKLRAKLGNESFVRNAPADVVAQDRARVAELEAQTARMREQTERVRQLL
jgi:valyl-tRNA synthetase